MIETSSPWKHRLLAGENICVNAARSMVHVLQETLAQVGFSQLLWPGESLLAVYVLLIYTMRNPQSWSAHSDVEVCSQHQHCRFR